MTPQKKNTPEILYKLEVDQTEDLIIIAIKSNMPDYKMAYHLNRNLHSKFEKVVKEVSVITENGITYFRHFLFNDTMNHLTWRLIENKSNYSISNVENTGPLFNTESDLFTSTDFLVPEWKTIDYFILIENADYIFNPQDLLNQLDQIKNISTHFIVDYDSLSLKSQKNLIF